MFQCSSASRKFLNGYRHYDDRILVQFQCSSASRKFLNVVVRFRFARRTYVSVLFSEPKIPQSIKACNRIFTLKSFSALQRAENSSMWNNLISDPDSVCFSALQRAENSSIFDAKQGLQSVQHSFSALQRAENSSIISNPTGCSSSPGAVSVLFSEPKIPQCGAARTRRRVLRRVSVLFSEPKIPQLNDEELFVDTFPVFQCSSASRKFLNQTFTPLSIPLQTVFQCSSASRKFLN